MNKAGFFFPKKMWEMKKEFNWRIKTKWKRWISHSKSIKAFSELVTDETNEHFFKCHVTWHVTSVLQHKAAACVICERTRTYHSATAQQTCKQFLKSKSVSVGIFTHLNVISAMIASLLFLVDKKYRKTFSLICLWTHLSTWHPSKLIRQIVSSTNFIRQWFHRQQTKQSDFFVLLCQYLHIVMAE